MSDILKETPLIRDTSLLTHHKLLAWAGFGVATYPHDASDLTEFLAVADDARFKVKGKGKNAVRSA